MSGDGRKYQLTSKMNLNHGIVGRKARFSGRHDGEDSFGGYKIILVEGNRGHMSDGLSLSDFR